MNWFKSNTFLAGILAVCLVGSVAFAYLIIQSVSAYSASSAAYTDAVDKLHKLQNKVPFPNDANMKAIQDGLDSYSEQIRSLRSQLAKMVVPLDEKITPQQFQDGLRTAVNDIRTKAEANGVKLPANFYFGFDQYQTQVPTDRAAPFLHRQFLVIQSLALRLVDCKVGSIDGVTRVPLPQESLSPSGGQKKQDPSELPVISRFPFDISFTAEQPKFRVAFNSLLGSDQFLIVRSLDIHNSTAQAPSKKSTEPASSNPLAAGAGAQGKDQPNMQVILGRESLKVTLHLEMLDFTVLPAVKK
ncbi:MAG: Amuc_1100 family pilus-like protein [Verrucomicrobiota bacterium]|jgi:hypothetical protein